MHIEIDTTPLTSAAVVIAALICATWIYTTWMKARR